jgi:uncharacterized protein YheU (UPF0270 family)
MILEKKFVSSVLKFQKCFILFIYLEVIKNIHKKKILKISKRTLDNPTDKFIMRFVSDMGNNNRLSKKKMATKNQTSNIYTELESIECIVNRLTM